MSVRSRRILVRLVESPASWLPDRRSSKMGTITTTDGVEIFYKDWGSGQPTVFSHGWPLSADDWDTMATGSSPPTGEGTAAPPRSATVTTWTTTPTIWPP
jgi:hypothetical protein